MENSLTQEIEKGKERKMSENFKVVSSTKCTSKKIFEKTAKMKKKNKLRLFNGAS